MAYSLTWLPDVLLQAGLKVARVNGWEERGHAEFGTPRGVLCHHTAGARHGNMPSLQVLIDGRPDLTGPLAQLGLGRDGTWYVVAAGLCYHAGEGDWQGVTTGNSNFIGIEAENTGAADDTPWPAAQLESYQRGVAAILKHIGATASWCAGHKEYALPKGRKDDPDFDMDAFRAAVTLWLDGSKVPAPPIPAREPSTAAGGIGRPTLRRGADNDPKLVMQVQTACGSKPDGLFGPVTEAAVRAFQRANGLVPDGIVGPRTWAALDGIPKAPSGSVVT